MFRGVVPGRPSHCWWQAIFWSLLVLAIGCANARAAAPQQAALIPQWEPQAQFAGYYVALAKGFYAAAGVDMRILRGGPGAPPSELLRQGKAQFGTFFLPTAIRERADGFLLVNLAQFVPHSNQLLVARKADGIRSPADLDGRRVSLWGPEFRLAPEALFRGHGIRVAEAPQGFTVDLFLRGGVAACSAMRYNEYHALLNSGLDPDELTVFSMAEYGLDLPEDGLYALESTWKENPGLCRAVTQASIAGWRYAFAHPEEALDIVMEHVTAAHLPTNRMHQQWMLEHLRQAMTGSGEPLGDLPRARYETAAEALFRAGLIPAIPAYEAFRVDAR